MRTCECVSRIVLYFFVTLSKGKKLLITRVSDKHPFRRSLKKTNKQKEWTEEIIGLRPHFPHKTSGPYINVS